MDGFYALIAGIWVVLVQLLIGRALLPRSIMLKISRWEHHTLSYLCGTSLVVVLANAMLAFGLPFLQVTILFSLGGVATLVFHWFRDKRSREQELAHRATTRWKPTSMPTWQFALLLGLGLASVAATLALPINEFDPLLHFSYKGKILAEMGSPLDPALASMLGPNGDPVHFGRIVTHPNYPLGIPILEALVAKSSHWNGRWVQLPLAFWALCLPAAVFFGLRQIQIRAAAAGALVAACTPILYARNFLQNGWDDLAEVGLGNNVTFGAGADLPLAAMLAGACALLLAGRKSNVARLQLLGGLCLGAAVLMKNEGLALFGVTGLALFLSGAFYPRLRPARISLVAFALAMLTILPWLHLRDKLPAIDENYNDYFTVERMLHFIGGGDELVERSPKAIVGLANDLLENPPARIDLLPGYFWEEFTDWRSWGLLWLLLLIAMPWRRREILDPERRWLTLLVVGGISLYFLILLVTPWYLPLLREKGIPERLLLHLLGPIAILIGWRLGAALPSRSGSDPIVAPEPSELPNPTDSIDPR
jgi:hypothetical protein